MSDRSARGAIFDLDGTLAETAPDLVGALNDLMSEDGLPSVDYAQARKTAGMGARALILYGRTQAGLATDEATIAALTPRFLALYEQRLCEETHLFDGAVALLDALATEGWRLGVCTNKPHDLALTLLERLAIADRFHAILGAGAIDVRKPDPRHLLETIAQAGADPMRSALVGDTATDHGAARAASVPVILVRFGYSVEPVDLLAPDVAVDTIAEIGPALERLV